jgi:hypothetical protein
MAGIATLSGKIENLRVEKSVQWHRKYWYDTTTGTLYSMTFPFHHSSIILEEPALFGIEKDKFKNIELPFDEDIVYTAVHNGWIRVFSYRDGELGMTCRNFKEARDFMKSSLCAGIIHKCKEILVEIPKATMTLTEPKQLYLFLRNGVPPRGTKCQYD